MGLLESWAARLTFTFSSARSPWEATALHETHSGTTTLIGLPEASRTQDINSKVTPLRWSCFPSAQLQVTTGSCLAASLTEAADREDRERKKKENWEGEYGDDSEFGSFKPPAAYCMTAKPLKDLDKHAFTDACSND